MMMRVAWFSGPPVTAASPKAEDSGAVEDRWPWVSELGDAVSEKETVAGGMFVVGDRGKDGADGLPVGGSA